MSATELNSKVAFNIKAEQLVYISYSVSLLLSDIVNYFVYHGGNFSSVECLFAEKTTKPVTDKVSNTQTRSKDKLPCMFICSN